jgi:hypothetical protein
MGKVLAYVWGTILGGFLGGFLLNLLVPVPHGWSSAAVGGTLGLAVDLGALVGISVVWVIVTKPRASLKD